MKSTQFNALYPLYIIHFGFQHTAPFSVIILIAARCHFKLYRKIVYKHMLPPGYITKKYDGLFKQRVYSLRIQLMINEVYTLIGLSLYLTNKVFTGVTWMYIFITHDKNFNLVLLSLYINNLFYVTERYKYSCYEHLAIHFEDYV